MFNEILAGRIRSTPSWCRRSTRWARARCRRRRARTRQRARRAPRHRTCCAPRSRRRPSACPGCRRRSPPPTDSSRPTRWSMDPATLGMVSIPWTYMDTNSLSLFLSWHRKYNQNHAYNYNHVNHVDLSPKLWKLDTYFRNPFYIDNTHTFYIDNTNTHTL